MKETHVNDLLPAYVDENLSEVEMRRIEDHLPHCQSCREELAYLERIQQLIGSRPEEPAPDLWEGLEERIQKERTLPIWDQFEWAGRRLVPLLAAAAVILFVLLPAPNGSDAQVTVEDFLEAQWDPQGLEIMALSEDEFSRDDILFLSGSAIESTTNRGDQ